MSDLRECHAQRRAIGMGIALSDLAMAMAQAAFVMLQLTICMSSNLTSITQSIASMEIHVPFAAPPPPPPRGFPRRGGLCAMFYEGQPFGSKAGVKARFDRAFSPPLPPFVHSKHLPLDQFWGELPFVMAFSFFWGAFSFGPVCSSVPISAISGISSARFQLEGHGKMMLGLNSSTVLFDLVVCEDRGRAWKPRASSLGPDPKPRKRRGAKKMESKAPVRMRGTVDALNVASKATMQKPQTIVDQGKYDLVPHL